VQVGNVLLYNKFRVVTVINVFNLKSMMYHCIRKTILNEENLSEYQPISRTIFHDRFFDIVIRVIYFTFSIMVG